VQWLFRRAAHLDWPSVATRRTHPAKLEASDTI